MARCRNNKCDKSIQNSKIKEDRVETIFFIPYIGLPSIIFSRKLKELFKKYYCIDIRIVFTSFKVKNYFSLKCRTPLPLLANVVYKFKCLRDANNIYIGKTIRHLATRVKEHGTSPSNSAVSNHLTSCETCKLNSYLVNWRPISLLNFDYKLLTKVLANRVKKVIPSIISSSQTAYVRDRSITDSVKLVQDIIHLLDLQKSPGLLLLVDFQKEFDSINWKYVIDILERFNFGPTFVRWVEIIYTNISSCVTNNGRSSHYFGF